MTGLTEWLQSAIESFKAFAKAHPTLTKFGSSRRLSPPLAFLIALGPTVSGMVLAGGFAALLSPIISLSLPSWRLPVWPRRFMRIGHRRFLQGYWNDIANAFDIDLAQVGRDWIGGLADGVMAAWADLVAWLGKAATGLMDWMPDWVKTRLGIDGGNLSAPSASAVPAIKPAIGPARQARVGGAVKVSFENAPANMRIREVKSQTPGFGVDVDAGYAMAGP